MPRGRVQRSAREWCVRGLLAAVVMLTGYISTKQTLAYTVRRSNPERAYALAPNDGRLAAQLARQISGPDSTTAERERASRLSRKALSRDPTAVAAVLPLGIAAQLRGDTSGARRLLAYSESLSRRDLPTQLWAIEEAVARDDVMGALRHYDIALRTSRSATELMFPILASAISDPAIRSAVVRTFVGGPPWSALFIEYLSGKGPDPQATALLFRGLQRAGVSVSELSQSLLINTLASRGLHDDAWSYYASVRPGALRHMSRDPDFTAMVKEATLFDWWPINDDGISTSIQRGDNGGIVDFSVASTIGGTVLQQVQMLPPGIYHLDGHSIGLDPPDRARPYWVLSCRDGRELGRVQMASSLQENGAFSGRFSVPAGCPVQTLALVVRPSDSVSGVTGQIDRVRLVPMR